MHSNGPVRIEFTTLALLAHGLPIELTARICGNVVNQRKNTDMYILSQIIIEAYILHIDFGETRFSVIQVFWVRKHSSQMYGRICCL